MSFKEYIRENSRFYKGQKVLYNGKEHIIINTKASDSSDSPKMILKPDDGGTFEVYVDTNSDEIKPVEPENIKDIESKLETVNNIISLAYKAKSELDKQSKGMATKGPSQYELFTTFIRNHIRDIVPQRSYNEF